MEADGLADVAEVDIDRIADGNRTEIRPEGANEEFGIATGAAGGSGTGHGDADDGRARKAEAVAGLGGNQQGECGVEAAGNGDDGFPSLRGRKALGEPGGLNGYDLAASGECL
jgi:hypothetical protein